ncbi:Bidirectional sugar transporter SWEET7 [Hondaea fermentalgiana]|uniref:Bidirectional sugar transporter SWEET7 n=1 Tax=Hondaea fermentalgiana TaxID=2315210 RepID=A0A2R5GTL8_9STRA|nr:Bidirectional sugar transporter SWEET7 [Hondaea fermentalgiana]|eukprot:GBG34216.1 Bidirectional sugar transporter SWEET7 [Hondaea fermentalgiana]
MGFQEVFVLQIAPVLGVITTELLYLGPMYAMLKARKKRDLGSLNPVLFAVTAPQALQWTVYGAMIGNIYLVLGSIAGIIIGVFYLITCARLCTSDTQVRRMETIFVVQFSVTAALVVLGLFAPSAGAEAAGMYSMISSLALYTTPLVDLRRMIAARDASSINRGFLAMQILSGFLWTLYSFFDFDVFVLTPSLVGLVFGLAQLFLVILFRGNATLMPEMESSDVEAFGVRKEEQAADALPGQQEMGPIGGCYSPPTCYRLNREESAPLQVPTSTDATQQVALENALPMSTPEHCAPQPETMSLERIAAPLASFPEHTEATPAALSVPMASAHVGTTPGQSACTEPASHGAMSTECEVASMTLPDPQASFTTGAAFPQTTNERFGRQRVLLRAASSHIATATPTPATRFRSSDLGIMPLRPRAMSLSPSHQGDRVEGYAPASLEAAFHPHEQEYQVARVATPGLHEGEVAPEAVAVASPMCHEAANEVFVGAAESMAPAEIPLLSPCPSGGEHIQTTVETNDDDDYEEMIDAKAISFTGADQGE